MTLSQSPDTTLVGLLLRALVTPSGHGWPLSLGLQEPQNDAGASRPVIGGQYPYNWELTLFVALPIVFALTYHRRYY